MAYKILLVKGEESRSGRSGSGLGLPLAKSALALNKATLTTEAVDGTFTARINFRK